MDWYIGLHLQWDPHPFLFGSPSRYVASCSLLLCNRLTSDPLPVAKSARPRPPLRPQLPLQLPAAAAAAAASRADVSEGVRNALLLRDMDDEEDRAETEGTGTAARSPRADACRGSWSGRTGVGGTTSTAPPPPPNRADEAEADDVEEKVRARGKV